MEGKTYIAIDLKSFYASVECTERGLDPITTNLVVADASRTEKTICLAVSPSLKPYGIPGRARLFEVVQKVRQANARRKWGAPGHAFTGSSYDATELAAHPELAIDFITATPQMAHYMACSTRIVDIYLKYVSIEDIHVYSIDEVFMDITGYLSAYKMTPRELTMKIVLDVYNETGITATAGIGTNLYLAKVAMDIGAKHIQPDENGVRIAQLDEMSYRRSLWEHRPLTDFWRVGHGYAKKLEDHGLYTMGDIARCSVGKAGDYYNEKLLYDLFGINAELLIDHAWGWEPCTMADIKGYKPTDSSLGEGQVLQSPYPFDKAKLVVWEMADQLALNLVDQGLVTDQIVLTVGYDKESLANSELAKRYKGEVKKDQYGRAIPKHAHGAASLGRYTSSTKLILEAVSALFDRIVDKNLLARRVTISAAHVVPEDSIMEEGPQQLDLFTDYDAEKQNKEKEKAQLAREKKRQRAILAIKKKHGKNAILKGSNLEEGGTTIERNAQIGGHKA